EELGEVGSPPKSTWGAASPLEFGQDLVKVFSSTRASAMERRDAYRDRPTLGSSFGQRQGQAIVREIGKTHQRQRSPIWTRVLPLETPTQGIEAFAQAEPGRRQHASSM